MSFKKDTKRHTITAITVIIAVAGIFLILFLFSNLFGEITAMVVARPPMNASQSDWDAYFIDRASHGAPTTLIAGIPSPKIYKWVQGDDCGGGKVWEEALIIRDSVPYPPLVGQTAYRYSGYANCGDIGTLLFNHYTTG